ncbi:MAG TPA: ABC transporter ATP-binding protein [Nocardia sp.]|nr:ABC transporter ATP-binding protein [Nocardia sp.]HLS78379.1 ABC transporter ATP-binding protein [Nocardia sp.]
MLSMTDVVRTYHLGNQVIRALDGVTVRIDPGQFVAVVGPSGAGKSTMLHLLGALDRPDSGSIRFRDEEIGSLGDDAQSRFRRRNIGFVFQFFNLLPTLSAWENVAVPMLLDGGRLRTARPRALELLATVGLADRAEHRPAELSGGQMQRVALARALLMDPSVILADEPTGNLDSRTGADVLDLLAELAHGADRAVVMVTHSAAAAAAADRVIEMVDGRVFEDRSRAAGAGAQNARAETA